jgi:hypothetical protein
VSVVREMSLRDAVVTDGVEWYSFCRIIEFSTEAGKIVVIREDSNTALARELMTTN